MSSPSPKVLDTGWPHRLTFLPPHHQLMSTNDSSNFDSKQSNLHHSLHFLAFLLAAQGILFGVVFARSLVTCEGSMNQTIMKHFFSSFRQSTRNCVLVCFIIALLFIFGHRESTKWLSTYHLPRFCVGILLALRTDKTSRLLLTHGILIARVWRHADGIMI